MTGELAAEDTLVDRRATPPCPEDAGLCEGLAPLLEAARVKVLGEGSEKIPDLVLVRHCGDLISATTATAFHPCLGYNPEECFFISRLSNLLIATCQNRCVR